MSTNPKNKLKPFWRLLACVIGAFLLCALAMAYQVNRAIKIYYFHDTSWPGIGILGIISIGWCIYLMLVAVLGRWELWKRTQ
jgi:membrane protein YdbS with pleckstrin-like domain